MTQFKIKRALAHDSFSPFVMNAADHHIAAAEHHEEAAESHRQAAAHYVYGDYQKAGEHARLARDYGVQAVECAKATE